MRSAAGSSDFAPPCRRRQLPNACRRALARKATDTDVQRLLAVTVGRRMPCVFRDAILHNCAMAQES